MELVEELPEERRAHGGHLCDLEGGSEVEHDGGTAGRVYKRHSR